MTDGSSLAVFIGGYFHQDWTIEGPNAAAVVDRYAAENLPEDVTAAKDEAEAMLAAEPDERLLADALVRMGLSYLPHVDGMTHREWLQSVVERLDTHLGRHSR